MGEAKRRQKLEPNFGKLSQDQLEIVLAPNLTLPEDLESIKQSLHQDGQNFEVGQVIIKEISYPALFIPFTQSYQGSPKLYSHVLFSPQHQPTVLTQTLIDRISQKVSQLIKDRTQVWIFPEGESSD